MQFIVDNWKFIISALFFLLLAAIVLALIFKDNFRKDVLVAHGEAKFFGLISVKGVVVVVLCSIFVFGALYPFFSGNDELEKFIQRLPFKDKGADEIKDSIDALITSKENLNDEVNSLNAQLEKAKRQEYENMPSKIEALSPEDPVSPKLREIAYSGKGPWSPYSESREILISVPGKLEKNKVLSCPELQEETLELISNYRVHERILKGEPSIKVRVNGLIFAASNCREIAGYDIKLNCQDANILFSDDVLECDSKDNPKWKVNDRLLPAYAAVIINNGPNNSIHTDGNSAALHSRR